MIKFIGAFLLSSSGIYLLSAGLLKLPHTDTVQYTITQFQLPKRLAAVVTARCLIWSEIALGISIILSIIWGITPAIIVISCLTIIVYLAFAVAITRVLWKGETLSCNCFGPGKKSTSMGYLHTIRALGLATSTLIGFLLYESDLLIVVSATWTALIAIIITLTVNDIIYIQSANKTPFVTANLKEGLPR